MHAWAKKEKRKKKKKKWMPKKAKNRSSLITFSLSGSDRSVKMVELYPSCIQIGTKLAKLHRINSRIDPQTLFSHPPPWGSDQLFSFFDFSLITFILTYSDRWCKMPTVQAHHDTIILKIRRDTSDPIQNGPICARVPSAPLAPLPENRSSLESIPCHQFSSDSRTFLQIL